VTAAGDLTLNTGSGAGDITFTSTVDGGGDLTLATGTGTATNNNELFQIYIGEDAANTRGFMRFEGNLTPTNPVIANRFDITVDEASSLHAETIFQGTLSSNDSSTNTKTYTGMEMVINFDVQPASGTIINNVFSSKLTAPTGGTTTTNRGLWVDVTAAPSSGTHNFYGISIDTDGANFNLGSTMSWYNLYINNSFTHASGTSSLYNILIHANSKLSGGTSWGIYNAPTIDNYFGGTLLIGTDNANNFIETNSGNDLFVEGLIECLEGIRAGGDSNIDANLTIGQDLIVQGSIGSDSGGIDIETDITLEGRLHWSDYISVTVGAATSTASSAEYNVFDEDSYGIYSYVTHAEKGIVYTPTDGRFGIVKDGVYVISCDLNLEIASTGNVDLILVAGVSVYDRGTTVHSSVDPVHRVVKVIKYLSAGDVVTMSVDGASNVTVHDGTTMNIWQIS